MVNDKPQVPIYLLKVKDVIRYFSDAETAAEFVGLKDRRSLYWRNGFVSERVSLKFEKLTGGRLQTRPYYREKRDPDTGSSS